MQACTRLSSRSAGILINTKLMRVLRKCDDLMGRELVRKFTENDSFSICVLRIRLFVTAWKDE